MGLHPNCSVRLGLKNLLAERNLPWNQKCFDQLALTPDDQTGKFLEPLAIGHVWLSVQPVDQNRYLPATDLPLLDTVEQMFVQLRRNISTQHLWHTLRTVKTPRHCGSQPRNLRRIFRLGQSVGQLAEFFATELTIASQPDGKSDYLSLLGRG